MNNQIWIKFWSQYKGAEPKNIIENIVFKKEKYFVMGPTR